MKRKFLFCLGSVFISLIIVTFFISHAHAYSIEYSDLTLQYVGDNIEYELMADSFEFSDRYSQLSPQEWEVESAVDDGNGGVRVRYNEYGLDWDSYWTDLSFLFQITIDYAYLEVETDYRYPFYFPSWADNNDFMSETGGQGATATSAVGYTNYSLSLLSPEKVQRAPEPTTLLLLGTGLVGLAGVRLRIKK